MKPLNEKERNRQFLVFISYFLVTTGLVLGIVYFNAIFNPRYHNEVLRKKNAELRKNQFVGGQYVEKVRQIYDALQRMKNSNGGQRTIEGKNASGLIGDFELQLQKDNVDSSNTLIIYPALFRLNVGLMDELQEMDELKEKYSTLKADFDELKESSKKIESEFEKYKYTHPD